MGNESEIGMLNITVEEYASLRMAAKRNKVYLKALKEIAAGTCCECCKPGDPHCDVGTAKEALAEARRIRVRK